MEITDSRRIFFYCNHDGLYGIDIAKDPLLLPEKVITSARLQRPLASVQADRRQQKEDQKVL